MVLTVNELPAKTVVVGSKTLTVPEGVKIAVTVDGVEDTDLSYTVPSGKSLSIDISVVGRVS